MLLAAAIAAAPPPQRSPDFDAPHHPTRVLVRFRADTPPIAEGQAHHRAGGIAKARKYQRLRGLQLIEVPAGRVRGAVEAYRKDPNVLYAEPDYERTLESYCYDLDPCLGCGPPPPDQEDQYFAEQWGFQNVFAEEAWCFHGGFTGDDDFKIAVIDSGIQLGHLDLAGNIWHNPGECGGGCTTNGVDDDGNGYVDDFFGWDFAAEPQDNNPQGSGDDGWHGTHVAGTLGAMGNNITGVAGMNWECAIVTLRIGPTDNRPAHVADVVAAFEYVIANNIKVSNNSYAASGFSQAEYDVIKQAGEEIGHIVVAAAGNSTTGSNIDTNPRYPASYDLPNIIVVAATDHEVTDALADFEDVLGNPKGATNYGPVSVDLGAPGDDIISTVGPGSSYDENNGSSMATPHVTGVVGLVWSRNPTWSWRQVRDRVLWTVRVPSPDTDLNDNVATGGVVNALAAVWDCNSNEVPDEDDIVNETSEDCTSNGTPDECEPDCNSNSTADSCDILNETSEDCQPEWEAGHGTPDECDIALGISEDCNENGVPDECENDCDGDGIIDDCDTGCCTDIDCTGGDVCCNYECEACCDHADCTGGDLCCSNVCQSWDCCDDSDCSSPTPACLTSTHTCVGCVDDEDCTDPETPYCGVDLKAYTCVECIDDEHCPGKCYCGVLSQACICCPNPPCPMSPGGE